MQIREFKYQEKHTKKTLVLNNGVYLTSRRITDFLLLLFQIDSFYVEVYFDEQESEIGYMRAFSSTEHLAPYLHKIDISSVLS